MNRPPRFAAWAVWSLCLAYGTAARAGAVEPPCEGAQPLPSYAMVDAPPHVEIWAASTPMAAPDWAPCVSWSTTAIRSLVAVAGSFRSPDSTDELLARFGAVSELLTVRYWSVTDRAWRPLVSSATPLTRFVAGAPRSDFTSAEMRAGGDLYLAQRDSRFASQAIYRMRVRESTAKRMVIETENLTPIRWWGITLFRPGDIESRYFLEQRIAGIWSYYSVTKIAGNGILTAGHERSYVNRVIALYRHLARIPSDLEPPAAP